MDLKKRWNVALKKHLGSLLETKPVIWAGDFNCIMSKKGRVETSCMALAAHWHPSLDIDNTAQGFWNKMSGLTEEERTGMNDILQQDSEDPVLVDVWRHLHPADEEHTCANLLHSRGKWILTSLNSHFSSKFGAWRLDSFIVSGAHPLDITWRIERDLD